MEINTKNKIENMQRGLLLLTLMIKGASCKKASAMVDLNPQKVNIYNHNNHWRRVIEKFVKVNNPTKKTPPFNYKNYRENRPFWLKQIQNYYDYRMEIWNEKQNKLTEKEREKECAAEEVKKRKLKLDSVLAEQPVNNNYTGRNLKILHLALLCDSSVWVAQQMGVSLSYIPMACVKIAREITHYLHKKGVPITDIPPHGLDALRKHRDFWLKYIPEFKEYCKQQAQAPVIEVKLQARSDITDIPKTKTPSLKKHDLTQQPGAAVKVNINGYFEMPKLSQAEIERVFATDISHQSMPFKIVSALQYAGVNTFGDLLKLKVKDVYSIPNLGRKSVMEIQAVIYQCCYQPGSTEHKATLNAVCDHN